MTLIDLALQFENKPESTQEFKENAELVKPNIKENDWENLRTELVDNKKMSLIHYGQFYHLLRDKI